MIRLLSTGTITNRTTHPRRYVRDIEFYRSRWSIGGLRRPLSITARIFQSFIAVSLPCVRARQACAIPHALAPIEKRSCTRFLPCNFGANEIAAWTRR